MFKGVGFIVSDKGRCLIGMNIISKYKGNYGEGVEGIEINTIKVHIGCRIREMREKFEDIIEENRELFITKGELLGWARVGEHNIRTVDTIPVVQPYRIIIPTEVESVKNQIDKWYHEGIIVKSNSEYASPLVVIKKGNGELKLCVDYRNLNKKTVKDAYPIPRIDDSLEALKGAKIFSCFDLKSAYNQIKVNKNDQHKTAFRSPWGFMNSHECHSA